MDRSQFQFRTDASHFVFSERHEQLAQVRGGETRICRDAMTSPGRLESRSPPPYDPSVDSCRSSEEKDNNYHIRESGGRIESGILFSNVLFHAPRPDPIVSYCI